MADLDTSRRTSGSAPRGSRAEGPTAWAGVGIFAAVMMLVLGAFHALAGFVALFQDDYYLVGKNDLVVHVDYTAWGWTHLIGGAIIVAAGAGVLAGQTWARVVGVILAMLSAVVNMAFFSAYPWWSAVMITLDILVIWALTVHGRELADGP